MPTREQASGTRTLPWVPWMRCAVVLAGVVSTVAAVAGPEVDLEVYRYGAGTLLDGRELYADREGLPFTYPPFAAGLFLPLLLGPPPVVALLWAAASVLALAWTLALVSGRPFPGPEAGAHRWWLVVATAIACCFEPVRSNLSFAQVNLFLMAAVGYDLLRLDRRRAGWLLGVAAGVKLTPLLFVVFLVLVGRRRAAGWAVASFLLTVLAGVVLLPDDARRFWSEAVRDPGRVGGPAYVSNQSVFGALTRLLDGEPSTLLWLLTAGGVAAAVLALGAAYWRRDDRPLAICLVAVAMLLASPISWSHHWVWAAPLTVVLWQRSRPAAVAWASVFVLRVIWLADHGEDRELGWHPLEHVIGNADLLAALALCGWLALTRLGPARPVR